MSKDTLVVSAFPGTGKTWVYANQGPDQVVLDSDSSLFSWASPGVRSPDFPGNYIQHVKDKIGQVDIIFVSSHKAVRDALVAAGIPFTLVYPEMDLRAEYLERYRRRGSSEDFVTMIGSNWAGFITELEDQEGCEHVVLGADEMMSDVINARQVPR
jgi:hypothetical protein